MPMNKTEGGILGVTIAFIVVAVRVIFVPDYFAGIYYFFILGCIALLLGFIYNERNR